MNALMAILPVEFVDMASEPDVALTSSLIARVAPETYRCL